MKNRLLTLISAISVSTLMYSCGGDPNSPGVEFMPDMYYSTAYETYAENGIFKDSMTALLPVPGTVSRGYMPYAYPNTNEGYEMAGQNLKNPVILNDKTLAEGKDLYTKFCSHCHGKAGLGDGPVPTNSDYPNPPAYNGAALKELTEGKMYHSITYGKNLMGSHASQLNAEERWKIIHYVRKLQDPERHDKLMGVTPEVEISEETSPIINKDKI